MGSQIANEIISMECAALDRWIHGDPSGFLEITAPDVVYFDPSLDRRLNGLAALTNLYESLRGQISADRYELIDPRVQVYGNAAVLTFNYLSEHQEQTQAWNCTEVYAQDAEGRWRIVQTHWSRTGSQK